MADQSTRLQDIPPHSPTPTPPDRRSLGTATRRHPSGRLTRICGPRHPFSQPALFEVPPPAFQAAHSTNPAHLTMQ